MAERVLGVIQWVISLVALTVLLIAIWYTLLRQEDRQAAEKQRVVNETLDIIRERIGEESWHQVEKSLRKSQSQR